jgi:uridine phosphorylase
MHTPSISYVGHHTAASCLTETERAGLPYLSENFGGLPPLVIAVGDRRRVSVAVEEIGLEQPVYLHGLVEGRRIGRVDMAIGAYRWEEGQCPILVVETQMGMAASEIVLREILTYCRTLYHWNGQTLHTNGITVIRVGTAAGINAPGLPPVQVGDIVCCTRGLGWSGTLLQSFGGLDLFSEEARASFQQNWMEMGFGFTQDGKYPCAPCSPSTIVAIHTAASDLEIPIRKGGNFSKDSLYSEFDTAAFIQLRKDYGVLTSEMEQMAILGLSGLYSKAGQVLHAGLISSIVGLIPGASFQDGPEDAQTNVQSMGNSLRIAARALALAAMMEQDHDSGDSDPD